jgi:hypothetical protein
MYGAVAAGRLVSNVQNVQRIVDGAMWPVQMEKLDALSFFFFFFFFFGGEARMH